MSCVHEHYAHYGTWQSNKDEEQGAPEPRNLSDLHLKMPRCFTSLYGFYLHTEHELIICLIIFNQF